VPHVREMKYKRTSTECHEAFCRSIVLTTQQYRDWMARNERRGVNSITLDTADTSISDRETLARAYLIPIPVKLTHEVKMLKTRFLRNKDLIPLKSLSTIGIVGLGGIGSFMIQGLAMMGWSKVIGYDSDSIESHNLSTTCYPLDEVGNRKVDSAEDLFKRYSEDWQKFVPNNNFGMNHVPEPKMIVCTDDMESRRMVYEKWVKLSNAHFFIDMRMGATSVELSTVTPGNDNYIENWIPTHAIDPAPCSMKHTVFATNHVVSLGLSQVYNLVAGLAYYDYIWTSLNPNMVEFGTLITPTIKEVSVDTSTQSVNQLDANASGIDISHTRAT